MTTERTERILLAEDEIDMLDLMEQLFRSRGFRPDRAETLAEIEAKLASSAYDALVADASYPDGDVWTLFGRLRDRRVDLPRVVILVSGRYDLESYEGALVRDVSTSFQKPIEPTQLFEVIDAFLLAAARGETAVRGWGP